MDIRQLAPEEISDRPSDRRTVASETVYEGFIWNVQRDEFELSQGTDPLRRDYITHPGAVSVLVLDDDDRVLLINQYRRPVGMTMWEIPAGLLDVDGEDPAAAAQRELAEEADLRAEQWDVLVDFHNSPGSSSEANRIFLARGPSEVPEAELHERDGEEAEIHGAWVPLDAAVRAVLEGRLNSPAAVVGLLAVHAARADGYRSLRPADTPWPGHPDLR
ncbi:MULTISPECIES: NUDIX hydrolase [unclassified Kocuria]|uniref:NUDIX domain-containing protein n=1 Tax=unclassified Kocuria TaxID=2649579 RepID=UPI00064A9B04|nr:MULTISPECIES: NUDIX hydrolase [unclassified Kocuria]KLU10174.1 ADP-ribose pyrophosphatase [Kocuria sp. SM24M-10]OLT07458.1 ADP-ribose pyrophosphatase [Kocuria sp. CNJ-770]